jgi:MCP family monocarboxylic acid transporter-like MFS transporter 10
MSLGALIDFRGFLDLRYTILCIGTFFAILGLWIPSYYISRHKSFQHVFRSNQPSETYANAVFDGNTISEYFLCIMNSSSILGAIV